MTLIATRPDDRAVRKVSHASLVNDAAKISMPPCGAIDAIVVPTVRGARALDGAARLAVSAGVPLVALCSGRTSGAEVVRRLGMTPCAALVIDVPEEYRCELIPMRTSAHKFRSAAAWRLGDLSLKRNLALLLARMQGWRKVLFLDDDIELPRCAVDRVAVALDAHPLAGFTCREFPDNSVVCHARRLAGLPQGTFVSGGALGVNCDTSTPSYYPNLYNEDWFFFAAHAAQRAIAYVGEATQAAYDPYQSPGRARAEEFGDLLAEGIYSLFEQQPVQMDFACRLREADVAYWGRAVELRRASIRQTCEILAGGRRFGQTTNSRTALKSLSAAQSQLDQLCPELCVAFVHAWQEDVRVWTENLERCDTMLGTAEALAVLGLRQIRSNGAADEYGVRRAVLSVAS